MSVKKQSGSLRLQFPHYNVELESKFLTNEKTMRYILDDIERGAPFIPQPVTRDARVNCYYDTNAFRLFRLGFECRGRKNGGGEFRYDLKTPRDLTGGSLGPDANGIFGRREYTPCVSGRPQPRIEDFCGSGVRSILKPLFAKELHAQVKGRFTRARFDFTPTGFPDSKVEIAFENGYFETMDGRHKSPEKWLIEIELKEGDVNALVHATRMLKDRYKLEFCSKTKGEMGLEFASHFLDAERTEKFKKSLIKRSRLNTFLKPPVL